MSDDLISRKALAEEVKNLTVTVTGLRAGKGVLNDYAKQYKESILRLIDEAPVSYDAGWIPVSERLPEENKDVWVTYNNGHTSNDFIQDGKWFWEDREDGIEVIAWRPLPEPYKEEK